eukprot:scpid97778/ scgid13626/ 
MADQLARSARDMMESEEPGRPAAAGFSCRSMLILMKAEAQNPEWFEGCLAAVRGSPICEVCSVHFDSEADLKSHNKRFHVRLDANLSRRTDVLCQSGEPAKTEWPTESVRQYLHGDQRKFPAESESSNSDTSTSLVSSPLTFSEMLSDAQSVLGWHWNDDCSDGRQSLDFFEDELRRGCADDDIDNEVECAADCYGIEVHSDTTDTDDTTGTASNSVCSSAAPHAYLSTTTTTTATTTTAAGT